MKRFLFLAVAVLFATATLWGQNAPVENIGVGTIVPTHFFDVVPSNDNPLIFRLANPAGEQALSVVSDESLIEAGEGFTFIRSEETGFQGLVLPQATVDQVEAAKLALKGKDIYVVARVDDAGRITSGINANGGWETTFEGVTYGFNPKTGREEVYFTVPFSGSLDEFNGSMMNFPTFQVYQAQGNEFKSCDEIRKTRPYQQTFSSHRGALLSALHAAPTYQDSVEEVYRFVYQNYPQGDSAQIGSNVHGVEIFNWTWRQWYDSLQAGVVMQCGDLATIIQRIGHETGVFAASIQISYAYPEDYIDGYAEIFTGNSGHVINMHLTPYGDWIFGDVMLIGAPILDANGNLLTMERGLSYAGQIKAGNVGYADSIAVTHVTQLFPNTLAFEEWVHMGDCFQDPTNPSEMVYPINVNVGSFWPSDIGEIWMSPVYTQGARVYIGGAGRNAEAYFETREQAGRTDGWTLYQGIADLLAPERGYAGHPLLNVDKNTDSAYKFYANGLLYITGFSSGAELPNVHDHVAQAAAAWRTAMLANGFNPGPLARSAPRQIHGQTIIVLGQ